LPGEYRHIDTRKARVILIEAGPRILPSFTEDLSAYAHASLERQGVEIQLGQAVRECSADGVIYGDRPLATPSKTQERIRNSVANSAAERKLSVLRTLTGRKKFIPGAANGLNDIEFKPLIDFGP
jgi:hypothetical protein